MNTAHARQPVARPVVLLVGRDRTSLGPLAGVLTAEGYDVRHVRGIRGALATLDEARVDLVITEHVARRTDGVRLVRTLRRDERAKGIPLFLAAAQRTPALEERALRGGAGMVLPLPLDVDQVVTLVRFAT